MVYEHLKYAYPGAWGALRRSHKNKEENWAAAEAETKRRIEEFSSIAPSYENSATMSKPAGYIPARSDRGKRHFARLPVTPATGAPGSNPHIFNFRAGSDAGRAEAKQKAATHKIVGGFGSGGLQEAWAVNPEPAEKARVQMARDNLSLRLAIEAVYAEGGVQARRPTTSGKAKQLIAQYHVARKRAPDGGFAMVTGADGLDTGLVKPHAIKGGGDKLSRLYALCRPG